MTRRRYLLDTNAVGDFLNHRHGIPERVHAARAAGAIIGTCEPVVAELFFGVENSATANENRRRLRQGLRRLRCWPLNREASQEFGRVVARLKPAGSLGKSTCSSPPLRSALGSCTVVTNDRDFLVIPGLSVEDWRTSAAGTTP